MHADLATDFSAREQRRVNIRVTFLRIEESEEAGKVTGSDVLSRNGQNVGGGPGPVHRAAVIGPVRTGGPAPAAAKEHDDIAIDLRLPEMNVGRLRWPGQSGPTDGPRNARAIVGQRAGEFS